VTILLTVVTHLKDCSRQSRTGTFTACRPTIATSIDYCNSVYCRLPRPQLSRFQQIQNSLARTVLKAPKSCHTTPVVRSLHWLKITERIEYKLLSLTYKVHTTTQPPYLHNFISVQCPPEGRWAEMRLWR